MVYFTAQGLKDIWNPKMTQEEKIKANKLKEIFELENGEQQLISSGHIAITKIEDLAKILS